MQCRRAPHGARGLKSQGPDLHEAGRRSRPARGAWIEISSTFAKILLCWRRAPHGARGLKCLVPEDIRKAAGVAPRIGCVD